MQREKISPVEDNTSLSLKVVPYSIEQQFLVIRPLPSQNEDGLRPITGEVAFGNIVSRI
ncbi:hypothetical protein HZS_2229 [Henneguya salminicola]|nr:hypothetical protein HZS_2229 [Henneguya salminicola]